MNPSPACPDVPPPASRCAFRLSDAIALSLLIVLLAWLVPTIPHPGSLVRPRTTSCAAHLSQLYKLGHVHSATHRKWPEATGTHLWISFSEGHPPLIDPSQLEVLFCPVKGDEPSEGACD